MSERERRKKFIVADNGGVSTSQFDKCLLANAIVIHLPPTFVLFLEPFWTAAHRGELDIGGGRSPQRTGLQLNSLLTRKLSGELPRSGGPSPRAKPSIRPGKSVASALRERFDCGNSQAGQGPRLLRAMVQMGARLLPPGSRECASLGNAQGGVGRRVWAMVSIYVDEHRYAVRPTACKINCAISPGSRARPPADSARIVVAIYEA